MKFHIQLFFVQQLFKRTKYYVRRNELNVRISNINVDHTKHFHKDSKEHFVCMWKSVYVSESLPVCVCVPVHTWKRIRNESTEIQNAHKNESVKERRILFYYEIYVSAIWKYAHCSIYTSTGCRFVVVVVRSFVRSFVCLYDSTLYLVRSLFIQFC